MIFNQSTLHQLSLFLIFKLIKSQLSVCRVSNGEASASHIFVVLGASGDLAKKKIYPTLWSLFKEKLMPNDTQIVGYARSKISVEEIRQKCQPFLKVSLVFTFKKKTGTKAVTK